MKIYFTRHGETLWNLEHRFQGWKDSELTENGVKRAELLGKRFNDIKIDKIFTSPIKRAKRTAYLIKGDKDIEIEEVEGLKEISFGKWEGMTTEEIKSHDEYVDELGNLFNKPFSYKSFEGENIKDFTERLFKTVDDIVKNNFNSKEDAIDVLSSLCGVDIDKNSDNIAYDIRKAITTHKIKKNIVDKVVFLSDGNIKIEFYVEDVRENEGLSMVEKIREVHEGE